MTAHPTDRGNRCREGEKDTRGMCEREQARLVSKVRGHARIGH